MTKHWLEELHRTEDWHAVADWLCRRSEYLAPSMAQFADDMRRTVKHPTARQFSLLISLRGGVEALQRFEAIIYDAAATRRADGERGARCGAQTKAGRPCGHWVEKPGDKCRHHRSEAATAEEIATRDLPHSLKRLLH